MSTLTCFWIWVLCMSVAVTCAAQPAPAPAHAEPKDTCPLPLAGPARPGHPYPETCSGVMQCLHVDAQSGAYSVKDSAPIPELREGDVLIKVSCAGVNRLDLLQAAGKYPPPPGESDILGVEVSGTVADMSAEAAEKSGLKLGDPVFALVGGGGYAEFCRAPYQTVLKIPSGVSMEEAAGVAEVFMTAYSGLFWSGQLSDGESVLIHAGASGVGLAAIQLAKMLVRNATVFVTASSQEKLSLCTSYGANVAINYKSQDFTEVVLRETSGKGVDVVLDFVGGPYWGKHMSCLAQDGRLVLLGLLGGGEVESPLNLGILLKKRIQIVPSTLRSRPLQYKHKLAQELSAQVLPLFPDKLKVHLDSVFDLASSSLAHERMKANQNLGKIIIKVAA